LAVSTTLHILENPEDFKAVEDLQRVVWPGSEVDIVPAHLLLTAAHNGGLVIGAYAQAPEDLDVENAVQSASRGDIV
jgi:predicted GNAT superfamily acetyltransferase